MSQVYGKIFEKELLSPTHLKIIDLVGKDKTVLELGSSTGYLTKEFKKNNCAVDIAEIDEEDAQKAKKYARSTYVGNLDDTDFVNKIRGKYDVVVAADVLEHLKNPENVLKQLQKNLNKNGLILISLPNIACWQIRKDLFFKGKFEYEDWGILDKTHLRFYTYETIQKLIRNCGYKIIEVLQIETDYPFKLTILRIPVLGELFDKVIGKKIIKSFPNLCTSHMIIQAKSNG